MNTVPDMAGSLPHGSAATRPGDDRGPGPVGPGSRSVPWRELQGRVASVLAVGSDGGRVGQLVGLVDDVGGDLAELVTVLAGVVGAEEQLTTRLELDPQVGLGSATVTAVRGAQRASSGQLQWSHRPHFSIVRRRSQRSRAWRTFPRPPSRDVSSDTSIQSRDLFP